MSPMEIGFYILVGLNVIQMIFWAKQVQRLVDKVMSRNYYDYETSKSISKEKEVPLPRIPMDPMEDMRTLNEINPF